MADLPRKRIRARNACESCRKRKRKCNGASPCSECVGYQYDCSFSENPPSIRKRKTRHEVEFQDTSVNGPNAHSEPPPTPIIEDKNPNSAFVINAKSEEPSATSCSDGNLERSRAGTRNDISILEPYKCRFTSANSAIAFPRFLGMDMEMATPPRLHSYAWNTGIRLEASKQSHVRLHEFCSWRYAFSAFESFFQHINPIFGMLTQETFMQRCELFWKDNTGGEGFEAAVCMVISLGSLFTKIAPCVLEGDISEHGRSLLEQGSQRAGRVTIDHMIAWVLRSIYLRSTSRPNLSSLAIATSMHLAESIGLHRELDTVIFAVDGTEKAFPPETLEQRRRVFWVATSLDSIFAAEYSRSKVSLDNIQCKKPAPKEGDLLCELIAMTDVLSNAISSTTDTSNLKSAITSLSALPTSHPFLALVKADIALCFSRRLHLAPSKFCPHRLSLVLAILRSALAESRDLSQKKLPWWNVVSVSFNTICLLLSINTRQTISQLPEAISTLEAVCKSWNTHLTNEALKTAQLLINRFVEIKREDQVLLEALHRGVEVSATPAEDWTDLLYNNLLEGMDGQAFGWNQFFDNVVG